MAELNVQQKNIVNQLRQAYPELKSYSDEQILSLYNQQLNNIQLSEDERISIMNGRNGISNDGMGLRLEGTQTSVSKEQEAQLKSALTARLNAVSTNVKKAEDSNGFLGKAWSWTKNTFNFGDSSDKVREQQKADLKALESSNIAEAFKKITGLDYTVENVNKFLNNEVQTKSETALNGYTEGQEMASDITADIISGIAAVGIYTAAVAAAPFTGGASIVVGVAAAGASAAAIKTGIKYADAKSGGREYTADNLKKDLATGAFSGVLAPITGGMGGAVGKTAAKALGIQAVKQVGKEVAEEAVEQTAKGFVKTMLTNPTGYEYIGGNMVKRGLAFAAEAATDGAIGGAVDNAFRTAYDGGSLEDIGNSAVEGFVGGAIMSPVIGGGMKVAGKGAQKIFGKNNVDIDANGNRVRVNDDGTVVRIDENGNEIPASATDAEIHIPKGVLASDIAPFIETDDGFRNIARNRARDIAELDKIKDVDEFLEKSFSMIKEEMGLADSSIKLVIGNDNYYDLETNTVFINRNWQNGDKAELFGAIAHELDHFLQWKEVIRNLDDEHPMYKAVYEQLTSTEDGIDNFTYILEKYNDAPVTELTKKQAKAYADSWQNYIEPADPKTGKVDVTSEQYKRYKEQPVEAEAMRRGNIVVEEYRRAISGNNSPSGMVADKSELYQRALSENPAEVVADKVYREWTTADVNTRVADEPVDLFNLDPYAGLKQSAPEVNGEVTSLIFTGKLKQKLTQRYVDLENTFKDIAKKRSSDIKALANACGNDRDKFANGLVEMLCEDLGMKGIAPQVKFIDINRGTVRGQANYFSGCIQIDSQVRTANELVDIVSHELTHMMQFKDILVQYGEKGIRELIKNAPDNLKERDFNAILNNPYTQKILQNIESFKQDDVGSLNEFIKRIYKEELATGVDSQKNPEIYFNQLLEREAYHLASEQIGKGVHSVDDVYFDEFNFAWDPVTGQFNMPAGVLSTSNNYLQRIQRVHFSTNGGLKTSEVKVYESFRRAMHKVLIATNGNAELPDNIHFREIPDHINGIACKDAATQSISINRCFLDNLDSSISKYIKGLQDVEMLKVDADGKIHIADFLRNDLTIEFEKKLNAYNESLSLADKLELYTQMGYFINLQNQARTNPIVTIEKIMVTGDNQAVLKKRGLFKSRDEVASMTAKEQVAYLKEIALITKIPEDAVLIRDVDQIFTHELGHLNHKLTPADESYLTSKAVIDEHRNNVAIQNTCSKVTQYAKESPKEFVAEVYSGLINGQKFDDDVMALYRKYKGPEVENATRANLPAGVVVRDIPVSEATKKGIREIIFSLEKDVFNKTIDSFINSIPDEKSANIILNYLKKYSNDNFQFEATKIFYMTRTLSSPERIKTFIKILESKDIADGLKTPDTMFMRCTLFEEGSHWQPSVSYEKLVELTELGLGQPRKSVYTINFEEIDSILKLDISEREVFIKLYNSNLFSAMQFHELWSLSKNMIDFIDMEKVAKIDNMCDAFAFKDQIKWSSIEKLLYDTTDEQLELINKRGLLRKIPNRTSRIDGEGIFELLNIDDSTWEIVQKRGLLEDILQRDNAWEKSLSGEDIAICAKLSDTEWEKLKNTDLLYRKISNKQNKEYISYLTMKNAIAIMRMDAEQKSLFNNFMNEVYDLDSNPLFKIEECISLATEYTEIGKTFLNDKDFPQGYKRAIASRLNSSNKNLATQLCKNYKKLELPVDRIPSILDDANEISIQKLQKLRHIMGNQQFTNLSDGDLIIACRFVDIYNKTNINEIPVAAKKDLLRSLVRSNQGLFCISEEMKKMFPLIPTDQESYCSLLPSIVRSMGIETNVLTSNQISTFNKSLSGLSDSLAKLSDNEFANLNITQDYSKDSFIQNVLKIVKDMPVEERQKVYDYFGFELHHNKENQTGFSITGYPVNLNNGKKLAQITDSKTKEIVELLRPEVIKFSEQNPIRCNNTQVEKFLNEVVRVLPELRAQLGKIQHSTHDFDILKHSLKVMQKISQDPKFITLTDSDKKVVMLASLLHDITKREGFTDKTHANEGAFDTFFIAKKFSLSREEEIKLYTLAKHHEWLEYVNTSKSEDQLIKRLQSVAYDLQNDNLFDLALMFTHADLRAVKTNDLFHDTTIGKGRISFDGTIRSYGESADAYAIRIREYVQELQKSQPLLPVTKIPTATRIADAITVVKPDGSTNIKGVYKDKDGLIVIKYNEVEDWEAIGFPKGSTSTGITAKGLNGAEEECDVLTGNIKFFVHGLDYENQLAKFDAFSLVDSDALLSISYTERPESKYRFFRPQGVILDFDTKYIHGGGNTDAGSGCGKSIADFKKDYIFGGERESDRLYVSDLIKEATGMNDIEYVNFIKENQNKPFTDIEPADVREKIIRALATINSNIRKGNREYNEMYGSNPQRVMGVFAYNTDYNESVGNPVTFLNKNELGKHDYGFNGIGSQTVMQRTEFLRRYALEHDVPFVIFGD